VNVETGPAEIAAPPADDLAVQHSAPQMSPGYDQSPDDDFNPADSYRALCTPAVASLVLGVLSVLALLDWWLELIPFAAVLLGFVALRKIRAQPNEFTGRGVALGGIVIAALFWLGGFGYLTYKRAAEVPTGYAPIDYSLLQPGPNDPPNFIPPEAKALEGKKVFIKGYVYPGLRSEGITQFLLVRDNGTCCFGGNPKITDRIQVQLSDQKGFNYTRSVFPIAGIFHVTPPSQAVDANGIVFYHLDEAILP
jgi:hypothetical protein